MGSSDGPSPHGAFDHREYGPKNDQHPATADGGCKCICFAAVRHCWTLTGNRPEKVGAVSAKEFSFKAELLWSMIPPDAQKGILEAVWCGQCRSAVAITDYFGTETNGNLILEGRCARCGG